MFTPEKSIGNAHKPSIHHSQANKYICACWILMIVSRFRSLAAQPDNFPSLPESNERKHQYSTSRFGAAHSCLLERILYAKNIHTWLYSERAAFTNTSQTCSPNALQRVPLRFLSSFLFSVFCFSPWSCVCGFSPQIAFGIGITYKALSVLLTKYREFTYKNICPASLLGTKCTKWQSLLATPECIFMHFVETP